MALQPKLNRVTKTLAELSELEIIKIEFCCLPDGMMQDMIYNLRNGTVLFPEKIRISMLLDSKETLVAWMLMDCAADYNSNLIDGCSIHFFTHKSFRKCGLARMLFEGELDFLKEQRPPLYAYVKTGSSNTAFDFFKRLEHNFNIKILITDPHLYLKRNYNVING